MSWLGDLWKRNRGAIGNGIKNISPLLAFTPLGLPGAAIAGGLGEAMRPGKNVGDILKSGASNAAIGGAARGVVGAARSAFTPGSGVAGSVAGAAPGEATSAMSPAAGSYGQAARSAIPTAVTAATPPPAAAGASGGSWLSKLMNSAKDNPLVVGQVAGGVLNAREQGAQTGLQHAQFDFQRQQYDDEKKRRDEMARLLAPLFQQMMQSRGTVAPNPYAGH